MSTYDDVVREPIRPLQWPIGDYNEWLNRRIPDALGVVPMNGFAEAVTHPGIIPPMTSANIVSVQTFMVLSTDVVTGNRK